MRKNKTLTERHNFINDTKFRLKTFALSGRRLSQNLFAGIRKFRDNELLKDAQVFAVSESELWNPDDDQQNWILTAGKIQNLRIAARCINGIEIPANQTFSFWKHIGNPNVGKGYVIGREIREGCIVPTIAGGLCQLSNALYDAALKANFEIVERHKHTKVIKGSLAEKERDATVKWSYIDLRFKSPNAFRIEVDMTAEKLIIRFRSAPNNKVSRRPQPYLTVPYSKLNNCYSCGNFQCFKHPGETKIKQEKAITTFILDDKWPEYDAYIKSISAPADFFILPFRNNKIVKFARYNWTINDPANINAVWLTTFQRILTTRLLSKSKRNIFSIMLRLDKKAARAAATRIPIESTHLVVSQNLLPFLWEAGVFGGRTFDVLMTRLPIEKLHQRLDIAHANHPGSGTLNDFRASQKLIDLESAALTQSQHIITPHQEIADIFNNKVIKLDWQLPKATQKSAGISNKIFFPASALGRKGAYEVRRLAKELQLIVMIAGRATENDNFWEGVKTEFVQGKPFYGVELVVYPAYVEHQPRLLLKAIAAGLTVVTTTASGLAPSENVEIVPVGEYAELKYKVMRYFKNAQETGGRLSTRTTYCVGRIMTDNDLE